MRVRLGGDKGEEVDLAAGDVVVLPAGTGHQNLMASEDLLVVGAYPPFGEYDLCRGTKAEHEKALASIPLCPPPNFDPVYGKNGPLTKHWRDAARRQAGASSERTHALVISCDPGAVGGSRPFRYEEPHPPRAAVRHMTTWREFWDQPHSIYVNDRHKDVHYRDIAEQIAAFVPGPDARVLDYGSGDAIHADIVAATVAAAVILCDAAPSVRAAMAARFAANPKITVLAPEEVERCRTRRLDLIVANSLAQYLNVRRTRRGCWRSGAGCSRPTARSSSPM